MPFKPGQSGNPAGRKKGVKTKRTQIRETIGDWVATIGIPGLIEMCADKFTPRALKFEITKWLGEQDLGKPKVTAEVKSEHKEILSIEHLQTIADRIAHARNISHSP